MQSLSFDLGPYFFYLKEYRPARSDSGKDEQPSSLIKAFIDDSAKQDDPVRKVRVTLNQRKLELLLNAPGNTNNLVMQL